MEQEKNEVEIFSSSNEYEINQVCAILKDNNIPFIRKDYGSGSYMNIYMGQSIQEKKIFVNNDCCDKALELISTVFSNENYAEENIQELEEAEENDDSGKKYRWIKYLLAFFTLGLPCITIIIAIIFSIFQNYLFKN